MKKEENRFWTLSKQDNIEMKESSYATDRPVATGKVVKAFGNLLHVAFEGNIQQGEVAYVRVGNDTLLKSEVIEIVGDVAKIQVFEDTRGVRLNTPVDSPATCSKQSLAQAFLHRLSTACKILWKKSLMPQDYFSPGEFICLP